MTQDKLNYLIVLAEEGSLTRASERLFISQPTLSGYLNRLEKNLGVKLFDRSHSPVKITPAGQRYIERMQSLLKQEYALREELRFDATANDRLAIGIGPFHSLTMMPDLVKELVSRYSHLDIQLREANDAQIIEMLKSEEIDLALDNTALNTSSFIFEPVRTELLYIIINPQLLSHMPQTYMEIHGHKIYELSAEDLKDLPAITPSSSQGLYQNYNTMSEHFHFTPRRIIQTSNVQSAVKMTARGLGYFYTGLRIKDVIPHKEMEQLIFCTIPGLIQERMFYGGYAINSRKKQLILECLEILKEQNLSEK